MIVRGEGEAVAIALAAALATGHDLAAVAGIAFRREGEVVTTPAAPSIADLDAWFAPHSRAHEPAVLAGPSIPERGYADGIGGAAIKE